MPIGIAGSLYINATGAQGVAGSFILSVVTSYKRVEALLSLSLIAIPNPVSGNNSATIYFNL